MRLARIPVLNEALNNQQRKLISYLQMIAASQNVPNWQEFVHDVRAVVDPKFGTGKEAIIKGKKGDSINANLYGKKVKIELLEAHGAAAQWVSVSQILDVLGLGSEGGRLLKKYGVRDRKYSLGKLEDATEEAQVDPQKAKKELQGEEELQLKGEKKLPKNRKNAIKAAKQVLDAVDDPTDEKVNAFLKEKGREDYLTQHGIDPDEVKAIVYTLAKKTGRLISPEN